MTFKIYIKSSRNSQTFDKKKTKPKKWIRANIKWFHTDDYNYNYYDVSESVSSRFWEMFYGSYTINETFIKKSWIAELSVVSITK